ncbi:MAG TPA: hypothetical protein VEI52_21570 [Terriglobales bacterium]|nr:hypothetical protein [Terriglobales bacterium]
MQDDRHTIGMGVGLGAVIGTALTAASQHAAVWLPLAIGSGLAIAVAMRDRRQSGGGIATSDGEGFPADRPKRISDH